MPKGLKGRRLEQVMFGRGQTINGSMPGRNEWVDEGGKRVKFKNSAAFKAWRNARRGDETANFQKAIDQIKAGEQDEGLALIFDVFDSLFTKGQYPAANGLLNITPVADLPPIVLVTILRATLRASNRLSSRPTFYKAVKERSMVDGWTDSISGLE